MNAVFIIAQHTQCTSMFGAVKRACFTLTCRSWSEWRWQTFNQKE